MGRNRRPDAVAEMKTAVAALNRRFPWRRWISAWEAAQDAEVPLRRFRMRLIAEMSDFSRREPARVLDLGCGPGSLGAVVLNRYPRASLVGVDCNPFMIWLARRALARYRNRVRLVEGDLLEDSTWRQIPGTFDAVISSTTLHWFSLTNLQELLRRLVKVLRPGGRLLITDPVPSPDPKIQHIHRAARNRYCAEHATSDQSPWEHFWERAGKAVGADFNAFFQATFDAKDMGPEEGFPFCQLAALLANAGFQDPELHWRHYGEAIVGATRA